MQIRSAIVVLSFLATACPENKASVEEAAPQPAPKLDPTPPPTAVVAPRSSPAAPSLPNDPGPELKPLPDLKDVKFKVDKGGLWAESETVAAALGERASSIRKVTMHDGSATIAWVDDVSCVLDKKRTFKPDYVWARLENTRGFRLYREKKFAPAAQAFRRAARYDPDYAKARGNYISALVRGGDMGRASQAFDWAMSNDAVHTYEKLLSDPDFKPLQELKLRKRKAKSLFSMNGEVLHPYAAYSKEYNLAAVLRTEVSWGSENWTAVLHIYDTKFNRELSQHTLVGWGDTLEQGGLSPARLPQLKKRLKRYEETLAALEFAHLDGSRHVRFKQVDPERSVLEAKLEGFAPSLVTDKGMLRLVQGSGVLEEFTLTLSGDPWGAIVIPETNLLVYQAHFMVSEGCDNGPETHIELFEMTKLSSNVRK